VLAYYRNLRHNQIGFLAGMEAKLLAIRDPGFRLLLRDLTRAKYAMLAGFITRFRERTGSPANVPADIIATGFAAFCDGVQFSHLADPEFVDDTMVNAVLTHYFEATVFHANGSAGVTP
jgi:hypothetical protein